jgi:hypothetical protein
MAKRKRSGSAGQTLGGIIVGFDYQVFRTTPPPHELVMKGQPVRGVSGQDGSDLEIRFPEDDPPDGSRRSEPSGDDPI